MKSNTSLNILIFLVFVLTLFHLLILFQLLPYDIVWGGRMKSLEGMYKMEGGALMVTLLFGFVLLMQRGIIKAYISLKVVRAILWVFLVFFLLNTVGNLLAETLIEKSFSVLTLIFVVLIWKVLRAVSKVSR